MNKKVFFTLLIGSFCFLLFASSDKAYIDEQTTKTLISSSEEIGDPVLLSTGRYVFEETDITIIFQGLEFSVTRYYQSNCFLSGAIESMWFLSIDSRILRCEKFEPENELEKLLGFYNNTKELLENSVNIYESTKKNMKTT